MNTYRCDCGEPWRVAGMHHDACPALRRHRMATHWRQQTGIWGGLVEFIVWTAVFTAVLRCLTLVLTGTAWLLERAA